jgi:hypothetical protein
MSAMVKRSSAASRARDVAVEDLERGDEIGALRR